MAYFGWPISRSIREMVDHIRCITTDYVTVRVGIGGWISGEGQADNGRDSGPPLPLIARTTTRILDDHEGDNNNEDDRTDDRDEDRRQWERSATVTTCDRQPSTITEGEEGRTWIVHVREREEGGGEWMNESSIELLLGEPCWMDWEAWVTWCTWCRHPGLEPVSREWEGRERSGWGPAFPNGGYIMEASFLRAATSSQCHISRIVVARIGAQYEFECRLIESGYRDQTIKTAFPASLSSLPSPSFSLNYTKIFHKCCIVI